MSRECRVGIERDGATIYLALRDEEGKTCATLTTNVAGMAAIAACLTVACQPETSDNFEMKARGFLTIVDKGGENAPN